MKLSTIVNLVALSSLCAIANIDEAQLAKEKKEISKRQMGLTSKITHKRLSKAQNYATYEQYDKGIQVLLDLLKQTENRRDEYAQVWQQLGFLFAQKEEMSLAMKALENSLKVNALPMPQTLVSIYNLAQLYLAEENYEKAHELMVKWFAFVDKPNAEGYVIMANILAQKDEKEEALKYINQAINSTDKPDEKWLQLALALNFEMENFQNSLKILAILTAQYPQKDNYWKQFSGVYLNLKQDEKALATMELAHKLGHLKEEKDILAMVNLQLFMGLAHRASVILQKEMQANKVEVTAQNMDLLSQCHYAAKDYQQSLETLKIAADLSQDGKLFARLGMMQVQNENWNEAIAALEKSLKKGGVDKTDDIYFSLAIARYHQKDIEKAMEHLFKARELNAKNESVQRWIDQLKNEKLQA